MSDSEDDSFRSKVSTIFANDNMTMLARGPKINNLNVTGMSFRNNGLLASMDVPANFERERFRDTMSLRSAPIFRPSSYSHSSYQYGMGSHRSMYNGRDESSTSVHSVETTASVISAANIVFAFNNGKLNKYDLRSIKDACNKLIKNQRRKRIEKRRKLKLFFKGRQRKSGDDSGEQGSDSSMSDDCRSVRTTICKENIPAVRHTRHVSNEARNMHISRNHMFNASRFNMDMRENQIFTDCTDSIKQNTMRNMISNNRSHINIGTKDRFLNTVRSNDGNLIELKSRNRLYMTQNKQFNKELVMPPQTFKKPVAGQNQNNNNDYYRRTKNKERNKIDSPIQEDVQSDSDEDENPLMLTSQNSGHASQNERFKKGFLLPSQRFNKTVADHTQDKVKMSLDIDKSNKKAGNTKSVLTIQADIESKSDCEKDSLSQKIQNTTQITQKERFKKGFALPSQRFNITTAGQKQDLTKTSNNDKRPKKVVEKEISPLNQLRLEDYSDEEEIFGEDLFNQKNSQNGQRKRALNTKDACFSNKKKSKLGSPKETQRCEMSESCSKSIPKGQSNDFIFAKPKLPVKKSNSIKALMPEKLLAKSRVPPLEEEINFHFEQNNKTNEPIEKDSVRDVEDNVQSDLLQSNSDVSMRPSFIKRKLFTQKLDIAENKNASSDTIGANSPQNIYGASIRERNKTRKLVTSKSCLIREVTNEDNNILDLIHKIVTPDQINVTNVANKTEPFKNRSKHAENTEKWDVSTVIANCDNQDISDTYTDEEIFNVNHNKKLEKPVKSTQNSKVIPQCKIVLEKLKPQAETTAAKKSGNQNQPQNKLAAKALDSNKINIADWMKTFWDTDSDSDLQLNGGCSTNMQQSQASLQKKTNAHITDKPDRSIKTAPISKGTILSFRNFHKNTKLNDSFKSDKNEIISVKQVTEISKPNTVGQEKSNSKIETNNKETNSITQTGKKKDIEKDNIPLNKIEALARKPKKKQCLECSYSDKQINTPQKRTRISKLTKDDKGLDSKNNNNSNLKKLLPKTTLKPKDSNTEPKQSQKDSTSKISKSGQKKNILKEPVRILPTRKSKENSFTKSPQLRKTNTVLTQNRTNKSKATNNKSKSKATKVVSNNNSINNTSIMTRSMSKLSAHSMECNYSNINNLSSISANRSSRHR